MLAMVWLILLVLAIGFIPAMIASSKGHGFLGWYVYGVALFIVALPHALLVKPNEAAQISAGQARRCPACAELVRPEATVCRHCGRDLPPPPPPPAAPVDQASAFLG